MPDLLWFLSAAALFDSISTAQQIVIVILLLSTDKPVRNALGFIVGVCGSYLACGLVSLFFMADVNNLVRTLVPNLSSLSDSSYYEGELLLGAVLVAAGPLYWLYRSRTRPSLENQLLARVKRLHFGVALVLGIVLTVTTFPFALPYIVSLGKIVATGAGYPAQAALVGLYNFVYALPLLVPFLLFLVLREGIVHQLHLHVNRLNTVLMMAMLSGTGLLLVLDSAGFLWGSGPLFANQFLTG